MIRENYKYFKEHFDEIYEKYPEKHVIVSHNQILGGYDSFIEAYDKALETETPGEFNVQLCSKDETKMVNHYYSNNVVFK